MVFRTCSLDSRTPELMLERRRVSRERIPAIHAARPGSKFHACSSARLLASENLRLPYELKRRDRPISKRKQQSRRRELALALIRTLCCHPSCTLVREDMGVGEPAPRGQSASPYLGILQRSAQLKVSQRGPIQANEVRGVTEL